MKKLRKLIALSLSLAMMSLTSASIFSVNAEEITEAVYYSESETQSEPVLTTATTNPLPVVIETEAEFADGAVIDFQGSCVKDFDRCCIEFTDLSEDFLGSEGYIVFEVVLNDIIYYVNFPYELYSDVLHMNFNEDYYNMYACCVGWSGNYSSEVVRIDYSENMANIHIRGISSGIAEFNVSDENGYSENFTVQVVPQGYTFPQDTSTTTSISGQPATSGVTDNDIPIFYGDVNCDGYIDIADVVTVSAYVADPEQNYLSSPEIISGDVHNKGDGITSGDVLMIQQFLAGIITSL